jgi:hypothetical protein
MKKQATKRRKPPRRKPTAKARLSAPDIGAIRQRLIESLIEDAGPEDGGLEEMVEELLAAGLDAPDDMLDTEMLSEFSEALEEARINANGGDPAARETLETVRAIIDKAARRDEIDPRMLMMLGQLFAATRLDIGDAARASMARILKSAGSDGLMEDSLPSFLEPIRQASHEDPFETYDKFSTFIDILPTGHKTAAVAALAAGSDALERRVAVGFLLHPEELVALAAVRGLAGSAARGKLDPESRRRIRMIRNWLAPARRDALDAAIPTAKAGAPGGAVKLVRTMASVCDGSGAANLYATAKDGSSYLMASLMTKQSGVVEALQFDDLPKDALRSFEETASRATPTFEVSLATFSRLVELALGRNLASGAALPFALVRTLETLGLETLVPDFATPVEIIDSLLAEVAGGSGAEAVLNRRAPPLDNDIAKGWFEAGEDVDAILDTADTPEEAAQALLESYLPRRRAFWASQCALSALAMKDRASRHEVWKTLALVGRDVLSDIPVDEIPLMRQIAHTSALAYFMNG